MLAKAIKTQLDQQRKDLQKARDALQMLVDNFQAIGHIIFQVTNESIVFQGSGMCMDYYGILWIIFPVFSSSLAVVHQPVKKTSKIW